MTFFLCVTEVQCISRDHIRQPCTPKNNMMMLTVTVLLLGLCQSKKASSSIAGVVIGCPETCNCKEFSDIGLLAVTNCSVDPIAKLPDLLISRQDWLITLSITSSHLSHIPNIFSNLTELINLYLQDNEIEEVPWECLKRLNELSRLDLSSNRLKILRNNSLYEFKSLSTLNLSNNAISIIELDVFLQSKRIPNLHKVDLSKNELRTLDSWPSQFSNIDFSYNYISALTNQVGTHKKPCRYTDIDLSGNLITHLKDIFDNWAFNYNSPDEFDECISAILVLRNPFICDCIDFDFYEHIHQSQLPYFHKLTCDSPFNLRGQNLASIPLDQFVCKINEDCPLRCTCLDIPFNRSINILCPNYTDTEFPDEVPSLSMHNFVYLLNFEKSHLKELRFKPYLWNTSVAKFSHSTISKVTLDVLMALSNGSKLYLDHNELRRLPHNLTVIDFKGNAELYLSGNPWVCDCEALETINWIVMNQKVISDIDKMVCHSPHHMKNKAMKSLEPLFLCPQQGLTKFIIIGLVIAVVALFVSTSVCFVYKKRTWIYQRTGWHPLNRDEAADEGKEFDVFVSYADEDEEYVGEYLIPEL